MSPIVFAVLFTSVIFIFFTQFGAAFQCLILIIFVRQFTAECKDEGLSQWGKKIDRQSSKGLNLIVNRRKR